MHSRLSAPFDLCHLETRIALEEHVADWCVEGEKSVGGFYVHDDEVEFMNRTIELATLFVAGFMFFMPSAFCDDGLWIDPRAARLPTEMQGPFVSTRDGGILTIDSKASYVSHDEGKTWSAGRPLFSESQNIEVSNERALLRTRDGVIIAAFMNLRERHWTWSDQLGDAPVARLPTYVMRSLDDGVTWHDVAKLHDEWTGAVRDILQTSDGRIIFTSMKMQHDPGRHAVLTYSSTDDGKSWTASNLIDLGGAGHHGGVTEPTLVELKDGRIWMLIRTNWGEFWSAYSHDGGRFWRIIQPSGISASSAPGLLKRLSNGKLLLAWNRPFPDGKLEWPLSGGDNLWSATPVSNFREELSLALSDDDGETWSTAMVIAHRQNTTAKGSARWVSYPYVFEPRAGELWITTMQGGLRVRIKANDVARIVPQEK